MSSPTTTHFQVALFPYCLFSFKLSVSSLLTLEQKKKKRINIKIQRRAYNRRGKKRFGLVYKKIIIIKKIKNFVTMDKCQFIRQGLSWLRQSSKDMSGFSHQSLFSILLLVIAIHAKSVFPLFSFQNMLENFFIG